MSMSSSSTSTPTSPASDSSDTVSNKIDYIKALLEAPDQLENACAEMEIGPPEYELIHCHRNGVRDIYEIEVSVGDRRFIGSGWSKRFAKCQAAYKALEQLQAWNQQDNGSETKIGSELEDSSYIGDDDDVIPPEYDEEPSQRVDKNDVVPKIGKWIKNRMTNLAIAVKN